MDNKSTKSLSFPAFLLLFSAVAYLITFLFYEMYFDSMLSAAGRIEFCLKYGVPLVTMKNCIFYARALFTAVFSFFLLKSIITRLKKDEPKSVKVKKTLWSLAALIFLLSILFAFYSLEISHLNIEGILLRIVFGLIYLIILYLFIASIKSKIVSADKAGSWFFIILFGFILLIFTFALLILIF